MSQNLNELDEFPEYWKYVRVGKRYDLGPLNHTNQVFELLGIKGEEKEEIKTKILALGEEADMGMLMWTDDNEITMGGCSERFNLPPFMSNKDYQELKERTIALIKADYPNINFVVGSR